MRGNWGRLHEGAMDCVSREGASGYIGMHKGGPERLGRCMRMHCDVRKDRGWCAKC